MPTAIIRPYSVYSNNMEGYVGSSLVAAVDTGDPVSHDDNTSYLYGELGQATVYKMQGVPSAMAGVNYFKVGIRAWMRGESACVGRGDWLDGSSNSINVSNTAAGGSSYETVLSAASTDPAGGTIGTEDFENNSNNFRLRARITGDAVLYYPRFTSLWGELSYVAPGGGLFVWLSWIPPLLAVGNLFGANLLHDANFKLWAHRYLLNKLGEAPSLCNDFEFAGLIDHMSLPTYCFL